MADIPKMRCAGLFFVAIFDFAGCVQVKPYQRELLALPGMQLDHAAESDQHALESREAATGAYGSVGGGCGCN